MFNLLDIPFIQIAQLYLDHSWNCFGRKVITSFCVSFFMFSISEQTPLRDKQRTLQ